MYSVNNNLQGGNYEAPSHPSQPQTGTPLRASTPEFGYGQSSSAIAGLTSQSASETSSGGRHGFRAPPRPALPEASPAGPSGPGPGSMSLRPFTAGPMLLNQQVPGESVSMISADYQDGTRPVLQIRHRLLRSAQNAGAPVVERTELELRGGKFVPVNRSVQPLENIDSTAKMLINGQLIFTEANVTEPDLVYGTVEKLRRYEVVDAQPDAVLLTNRSEYDLVNAELHENQSIPASRIMVSRDPQGRYAITQQQQFDDGDDVNGWTRPEGRLFDSGRATPRFERLMRGEGVDEWNDSVRQTMEAQAAQLAHYTQNEALHYDSSTASESSESSTSSKSDARSQGGDLLE